MGALRCTQCNENWPAIVEYAKCPRCGQSTWLSPSSVALEMTEAESIVNWLKFEKYYDEREIRKAVEEAKAAKQWIQEMTELVGEIDPAQFEDLAFEH